MDPIESLVRERFETAVGDVELDVVSLVGAGMARGRRLRRTRRVQQGIGAVAGVAVIAAVGLVGVHGGWFDNSAPPAKHGTITEMVPSNPRALAAAVIAKFPAGWKTEGVNAQTLPHAKNIGDSFGVSLSGQLISLQVDAYPVQQVALNCKGRNHETSQSHETCIMLALPGGGRLRLDTMMQGPGTPASDLFVTAIAHRSDGIVAVQITQLNPGTLHGQVGVWNRLAKVIATDPAVGLQTTKHFINIEGTVPHFHPYRPPSPPPTGSGTTTSPHK